MEHDDGVMVLGPTHDLIAGPECDEMEAELLRLATSGERVVVDLSRVRHVTARCLGILAHAQEVAAANGGGIALCGTSRVQRWLLRRTGVSQVVTVHADLESARKHIAAAPRAVA